MRFDHQLDDILKWGYLELDIPPTANLPTLAETQRDRIHASFRLQDGLWHRFRLSDVNAAARMDAALSGPLIGKKEPA